MQQQIPAAEPSAIKKYSAQFSSFGTDYIFSRVTKTEQFSEFNTHTMRLKGMSMILCLSGSIDLNVNLESCHMSPGMLLVMSPDCVFNVNRVDWDNLDAYVFVTSPEFIRDINFEVSIMTSMNLNPNQPLLLNLGSEEVRLMSRYFDLIYFNTVDNTDARYVRSISRSLIAAAVYQLMQFVSRRADSENSRPAPRQLRKGIHAARVPAPPPGTRSGFLCLQAVYLIEISLADHKGKHRPVGSRMDRRLRDS